MTVQIHKEWINIGIEYAMAEASTHLNPTMKQQKEFGDFLKKLNSTKLHLYHSYFEAGKATNNLPDINTFTTEKAERRHLHKLDENKIWLVLKVTEGMMKRQMEELGRGY